MTYAIATKDAATNMIVVYTTSDYADLETAERRAAELNDFLTPDDDFIFFVVGVV